MNINFGLFPHIEGVASHGPDGKRLKGPAKSVARKQALTARAKSALDGWISGTQARAAE
jgi:methylenetetrahydrofolate--tRNA-(uracil-5-)-methyltransferase